MVSYVQATRIKPTFKTNGLNQLATAIGHTSSPTLKTVLATQQPLLDSCADRQEKPPFEAEQRNLALANVKELLE